MTDMNDERRPDDRHLDEEAALDRDLAATDDARLRTSLAQLLTAPADLETRTQHQVTNSLLNRSVLGTGADLLTVGWQTVRLLFTDPEDEEEAAR